MSIFTLKADISRRDDHVHSGPRGDLLCVARRTDAAAAQVQRMLWAGELGISDRDTVTTQKRSEMADEVTAHLFDVTFAIHTDVFQYVSAMAVRASCGTPQG